MSYKIDPVKLDINGHVIPPGAKTRVAQWRVTLGKKITGDKKQRRFFATEREAKEWIADKLAERKRKGEAAFSITDRLRVEALECQRRLQEVGASLTQAVDYYLRHAMPSGGKKTFAEVADEFLVSRRAMGCKAKTMAQYESYMKVIKDEWSEELLHQLKQADLEDWLSESEWAPRTRKNYISHHDDGFEILLSAANTASPIRQKKSPVPYLTIKRRAFLPPMKHTACSPCRSNARPSSPRGLPSACSRVCAVPNCARSIGARSIWRHASSRSRLGRPRRASAVSLPISDNLALWLAPSARKSGPVVFKVEDGKYLPLGVDMFGEKLKHLVRGRPKTDQDEGRPAITDPWPHNAIRHSFGSYFYAKAKNENTTRRRDGQQPADGFHSTTASW